MTLNKPYATLLKSFGRAGIAAESVFFVDAITNVRYIEEDATHVCLGSGIDLSTLGISISKAIKQIKEDRFLLLDSLSTLLIYYDAKAVVKFAQPEAQAELFLDAIGRGILEFLKEEAGFQYPDELREATSTLASFFTKNGLADRIDVQLSRSEVRVEFENYRYAPVLKQALSEGLRSVSCPFLLALKALLRGDGRTVEEWKWDFRNGRDASLVMRLRGVTDEFDEERTNALMD